MKTISQVMGDSVYAIARRAGVLPHQLRRREIRETACERQNDQSRTKGRDRRRPSMGHGNDRERPECDLEGASASLRRDRKRRHQCVGDDADSDCPEQERL